MPIRYMGTKRSIASRVRRQVASLAPRGQVLDLFSGMGCVAEALATVAPVRTNDALSFTAAIAKARFKGERTKSAHELVSMLREPYREAVESETRRARIKLRDEQRAVDLGQEALLKYVQGAEHVGNSTRIKRAAASSAKATGISHYRLLALYFSAGYFSTRQAIHLDALRYAIDIADLSEADRDWALSAWLTTAAVIINAPGHTAQHLKPNTESAYRRMRRCWIRSTWDTFVNEIVDLKSVGTAEWRESNAVGVDDAIGLLKKLSISDVAAVYADPPYTKDQYSRYYHVYETMYRYDYPESLGTGRARSDRFTSSFCLKTQVESSFRELFSTVAALQIPLVLSYPSDSLLSKADGSLSSIGSEYMRFLAVESFPAEHSTMGASKGSTTKSATENIYVYAPQ